LSEDIYPAAQAALERIHAARSVKYMLQERKAFGLEKYDTVLRSHNGRDSICDGAQELLDAIVYITQARLEDRPVLDLLPLAQTVLRLITMYK
jgi:hypothetical protein